MSSSTDEALIEQYIEIPPHGRADARLRMSGVHIWALIGQVKALDGDVRQLALDYDLPCAAVDAALAYYRHYREYIDARLLLSCA